MGEFHDAVSTLLQAFACGISIIKTQRGQREQENLRIGSSRKNVETRLSKSFRKDRFDVKSAYGRDLDRFGPRFANGDAEARSSLSAILFRLNAGIVSIIERFTRGRSTPTDYQALLNLSNSSRMEAINTFDQLSQRLSRSSLALVPSGRAREITKYSRTVRKHKSGRNSSNLGSTKHGRSKSALELSATPLGLATSEGWVRPKGSRKKSSDSTKSSKSSRSTSPKRSSSHHRTPRPARKASPNLQTVLPPSRRTEYSKRPRQTDRKSIVSFASDSTKLGEIPEHKWTRPAVQGSDGLFATAYYPLEPYREPPKQRSRFMRLFGR